MTSNTATAIVTSVRIACPECHQAAFYADGISVMIDKEDHAPWGEIDYCVSCGAQVRFPSNPFLKKRGKNGQGSKS